MIIVDSRTGSKELLPYIRNFKVKSELSSLLFGDSCFEGNGPKGKIMVGVERKTLHDMLHCIDDSRYSAYQRPGMQAMYDQSYLLVEGLWKPHENGFLMEGFNGSSWGPCRYRSKPVLYSKLRRYLFSMSLSNVTVLYSRDIVQTAFDMCELFHYYQKKWDQHTSLLETQKLNLPSLQGKASLVRKWAADIDDVGVKFSESAEGIFKTPLKLAQSSELDWMRVKGIGVATAQSIIRQIWGIRK